ncbi:MAG: sulfite exporter TauE/SafE family protein [Gammaproteobacteria bacterium]|nr:sulfite exporter TauE/SafE family protein [Gammaproteobacteria bacterium]MBU1489725.1 sulfite exporter TauE/SafE family protein [Gammaproteobacteria bacterium]MBU2065081.1 sulfite exporter TauE/SafE family protein [Gammaproteobacteria bacterium]MBU2137579.1 sulfite exporter TauE/SafE family protein [Gammaproteobacteria bacterium]MBU2216459.1 sulfite exporter TauE/SafE family protein [Gammaproteobacteria bacterium]
MFAVMACVAGLVRGYSGFGFAIILALGLLLHLPPALAIPVTLMLDLLCSISLLPSALRQFDRPVTACLVGGMLLAVLPGVWLLSWLSGDWLTPLIALLCLFGGVAVLWQPAPRLLRPSRRPLAVLAGLVSGLATSLASAGGPPLMLYLVRSGVQPQQMRGTAILFFLASSACALLGLWGFGVLQSEHGRLVGQLLVPALLGNLLGQWAHRRWPPRSVRVLVGSLLVLLSALTLWHSLVGV